MSIFNAPSPHVSPAPARKVEQRTRGLTYPLHARHHINPLVSARSEAFPRQQLLVFREHERRRPQLRNSIDMDVAAGSSLV